MANPVGIASSSCADTPACGRGRAKRQRHHPVPNVTYCAGHRQGSGDPCRLHSGSQHRQAEPLRNGGRFCAHHEPDVALSNVVRCKGTCPDGEQCRITSACSFGASSLLRKEGEYCRNHAWQGWTPPTECTGTDGSCISAMDVYDKSVVDTLGLTYCDACNDSWHKVGGWCSAEDRTAWFRKRGMVVRVRCEGITANHVRCGVTSLHLHNGALPLRCGSNFCTAHGGVPLDEPCESGALPLERNIEALREGQRCAQEIRGEREQMRNYYSTYGAISAPHTNRTWRTTLGLHTT